jgi:hypothetical protein
MTVCRYIQKDKKIALGKSTIWNFTYICMYVPTTCNWSFISFQTKTWGRKSTLTFSKTRSDHALQKIGVISQYTNTYLNTHGQGCQIFLGTTCQKRENIHQMAIKQIKWAKCILIFSIPRPSKLYPKWDFWYENIPIGNPAHRPHSNTSL